MRELLNRTTIKDCDVSYFRGHGPGGQHRNKTDTGVRVVQPPSGARAESCETRSQAENRARAFVRMAESDEYQRWARGLLDAPEVPETLVQTRCRTYNLVERRVVDHRTGRRTSRVSDVLDGDLDSVR